MVVIMQIHQINERIPTPHIHIYTEEYNNGGIAIPLRY